MIRALIVDDEEPARAKIRLWLSQQPDVTLVAEFADGLSAAPAISTRIADVVFLDVQMPGLTGLELAAQIETSEAPLFVFVTAYDAHALAAFDVAAVDYLLKPYDQERFDRALERVRERLRAPSRSAATVQFAQQQSAGRARLLVPTDNGLRVIESDHIHFLEAADNYVCVHTSVRSYLLRRTLRSLLLQIGEAKFPRIHKSTAVNITQIDTFSPLFKGDYELRLRSGKILRLSRRYAPTLFSLVGR